MNSFKKKQQFSLSFRSILIITLIAFIFTTIAPSMAMAQSVMNLPTPGAMVPLSQGFQPVTLRGISIYPDNPLQFDFIVNPGDTGLTGNQLKTEGQKLIRYFLASMTVPESDLWVNLSPYEKGRIISEDFGKTEMGRDLLAQDYILKQITASIVYPENKEGKKFWDRVYKQAFEKYGTTDIPVETFNKVWITPKDATVIEHDSTAYVAKSRLKVSMERDLVSRVAHFEESKLFKNNKIKETNDEVQAQIFKEVIIPQIEKEVNEGENFANLRQIYSSMILASWYKDRLQETLLAKVYADKNKTKGVEHNDPAINQEIYDQYLQAFNKGVYNYIKDDVDPVTNQVKPKKYFSGGTEFAALRDITARNRIKVGDKGMMGLNHRKRALVAQTAQTKNDFVMTASLVENGHAGESDRATSDKKRRAAIRVKLSFETENISGNNKLARENVIAAGIILRHLDDSRKDFKDLEGRAVASVSVSFEFHTPFNNDEIRTMLAAQEILSLTKGFPGRFESLEKLKSDAKSSVETLIDFFNPLKSDYRDEVIAAGIILDHPDIFDEEYQRKATSRLVSALEFTPVLTLSKKQEMEWDLAARYAVKHLDIPELKALESTIQRRNIDRPFNHRPTNEVLEAGRVLDAAMVSSEIRLSEEKWIDLVRNYKEVDNREQALENILYLLRREWGDMVDNPETQITGESSIDEYESIHWEFTVADGTISVDLLVKKSKVVVSFDAPQLREDRQQDFIDFVKAEFILPIGAKAMSKDDIEAKFERMSWGVGEVVFVRSEKDGQLVLKAPFSEKELEFELVVDIVEYEGSLFVTHLDAEEGGKLTFHEINEHGAFEYLERALPSKVKNAFEIKPTEANAREQYIGEFDSVEDIWAKIVALYEADRAAVPFDVTDILIQPDLVGETQQAEKKTLVGQISTISVVSLDRFLKNSFGAQYALSPDVNFLDPDLDIDGFELEIEKVNPYVFHMLAEPLRKGVLHHILKFINEKKKFYLFIDWQADGQKVAKVVYLEKDETLGPVSDMSDNAMMVIKLQSLNSFFNYEGRSIYVMDVSESTIISGIKLAQLEDEGTPVVLVAKKGSKVSRSVQSVTANVISIKDGEQAIVEVDDLESVGDISVEVESFLEKAVIPEESDILFSRRNLARKEGVLLDNRRVYFAHKRLSPDENVQLYKALEPLKESCDFILPHKKDHLPFESRKELKNRFVAAMVAEVSAMSAAGMGLELFWANKERVPIVLLVEKSKKAQAEHIKSQLKNQNNVRIVSYQEQNEISTNLQQPLEEFVSPNMEGVVNSLKESLVIDSLLEGVEGEAGELKNLLVFSDRVDSKRILELTEPALEHVFLRDNEFWFEFDRYQGAVIIDGNNGNVLDVSSFDRDERIHVHQLSYSKGKDVFIWAPFVFVDGKTLAEKDQDALIDDLNDGYFGSDHQDKSKYNVNIVNLIRYLIFEGQEALDELEKVSNSVIFSARSKTKIPIEQAQRLKKEGLILHVLEYLDGSRNYVVFDNAMLAGVHEQEITEEGWKRFEDWHQSEESRTRVLVKLSRTFVHGISRTGSVNLNNQKEMSFKIKGRKANYRVEKVDGTYQLTIDASQLPESQQQQFIDAVRKTFDVAMITRRQYEYPAGGFKVNVENPNKNEIETSEGVLAVGMSMSHRLLAPDADAFPGIIMAPAEGAWVGKDGSNRMQIYFAIESNYYEHNRRTKIIVRNEGEKKRIIRYLELGNADYLPNEAGYSDEFINQFRREAIVLADRVKDDGGVIKMISALDMVDFYVMEEGQVKIGEVTITDNNDNISIDDDGRVQAINASSQEDFRLSFDGVERLEDVPDFGVTFLGTSHGNDANGLPSNQIIWANKKGVLVDVSAQTVDMLEAKGIKPEDIPYVAITHIHEDHVAGLLRYFARMKEHGQSIQLVAEPGIYKLLKEQLEVILNQPLESVYDVNLVSVEFDEKNLLEFKKPTSLNMNGKTLEVFALPAFHGTPTASFRFDYKGKTISHSSDTAIAPMRLGSYSNRMLQGIPKEVIDDLFELTDYRDLNNELISKKRATQIQYGLLFANNKKAVVSLVVLEAGYPQRANAFTLTNHTSPYDIETAFTNEAKSKIIVNHTAGLPDDQNFTFTHAKPFSTVDLSADVTMLSKLGMPSVVPTIPYQEHLPEELRPTFWSGRGFAKKVNEHLNRLVRIQEADMEKDGAKNLIMENIGGMMRHLEYEGRYYFDSRDLRDGNPFSRDGLVEVNRQRILDILEMSDTLSSLLMNTNLAKEISDAIRQQVDGDKVYDFYFQDDPLEGRIDDVFITFDLIDLIKQVKMIEESNNPYQVVVKDFVFQREDFDGKRSPGSYVQQANRIFEPRIQALVNKNFDNSAVIASNDGDKERINELMNQELPEIVERIKKESGLTFESVLWRFLERPNDNKSLMSMDLDLFYHYGTGEGHLPTPNAVVFEAVDGSMAQFSFDAETGEIAFDIKGMSDYKAGDFEDAVNKVLRDKKFVAHRQIVFGGELIDEQTAIEALRIIEDNTEDPERCVRSIVVSTNQFNTKSLPILLEIPKEGPKNAKIERAVRLFIKEINEEIHVREIQGFTYTPESDFIGIEYRGALNYWNTRRSLRLLADEINAMASERKLAIAQESVSGEITVEGDMVTIKPFSPDVGMVTDAQKKKDVITIVDSIERSRFKNKDVAFNWPEIEMQGVTYTSRQGSNAKEHLLQVPKKSDDVIFIDARSKENAVEGRMLTHDQIMGNELFPDDTFFLHIISYRDRSVIYVAVNADDMALLADAAKDEVIGMIESDLFVSGDVSKDHSEWIEDHKKRFNLTDYSFHQIASIEGLDSLDTSNAKILNAEDGSTVGLDEVQAKINDYTVEIHELTYQEDGSKLFVVYFYDDGAMLAGGSDAQVPNDVKVSLAESGKSNLSSEIRRGLFTGEEFPSFQALSEKFVGFDTFGIVNSALHKKVLDVGKSKIIVLDGQGGVELDIAAALQQLKESDDLDLYQIGYEDGSATFVILKDEGMLINGGIKLDRASLNLQIRRYANGVAMPVAMQPINDMVIEGFIAIIHAIRPIENLPVLLGI